MVPKIHARGRSFKGAAAYLLHDKNRAKSADRVAWTEVRNLATDNPHVAWKVMAATAMDQDRLKEQANIKKTGRKSFDAVLHFTLSWHPEEQGKVNREEMLRSAHGAIRALQASDRQAIIICHGDEPQPHIHVLLNRVSPDDGRMLTSSKEKLALSEWAELYEKERGIVYCEERVLNNDARRRNEFTRGKKDKARNILEAEAELEDTAQAKILRDKQRRKDAEIAQKARALWERQHKAFAAMEEQHKNGIAAIKEQAAKLENSKKAAIRENLRPEWTMLFHEQQAQMRDFEKREQTFLGRFKNVLGAVDLKAIIHGRKDAEAEARSRGQAISEAFQALSSAGVRLEALKRQQERETKVLDTQQKQQEKETAAQVRTQREAQLEENRQRFERERNDLILAQSMDNAKLRAERKASKDQKQEAWETYRSSSVVVPSPAPPAYPANDQKQQNTQTHTNFAPDDIQRAREIEQLRERMSRRQDDQHRSR